MKPLLKLALFLSFLIIIPVLLFTYSSFFNHSDSVNNVQNGEKHPYRFICIYSGSSEYYKYALNEGLNKAAQDLGVWVRFYEYKPVEADKHMETFDMALAAKVDGIITDIPANGDIQSYIDSAYRLKIPVITIENDLPNSKRISFIGTNSYAYGTEAGKLLVSASKGRSNTAIFNSMDTGGLNLKNQGFMDEVKKNPGMDYATFDINEPSIIEYTNIAQSIFVNHTLTDSFFCSDPECTLGVVRAMVEFNKTNKLVIGSGDSAEILKYVKDGLIYASLVEDPYSIGYLSVSNLLKYRKGESISQLINPDIIVVTRDNADRIIAERDGKE